mgnify:CR=1 FL=1
MLVAITAEEGFGNLREGDIAEQVFSAGVRIAILRALWQCSTLLLAAIR